jgi:hypothetical protein
MMIEMLSGVRYCCGNDRVALRLPGRRSASLMQLTIQTACQRCFFLRTEPGDAAVVEEAIHRDTQ